MRIFIGGSTLVLLALMSGSVTLHSQSGLQFVRTDSNAIGAPRSIVSADFNRDGFVDVALGGTGRASIGILYHHGLEDGDEGQRFQPLQEIVVGGGPFELAAADLNRDGLIDIAVANADANAVTVLLNDAQRSFSSIVNVPVADNPRGLAVADFNRDGIPDVAVSKYMGTSFDVLYGAGNGTFPTRRTYPAPANAQGVVAADFDHDGNIDVALACGGGIVSRHFMDRTGGAFRDDVKMADFAWNVITAGEFNRDGVIDLAVASTPMSIVNVLFQARSRAASFSQSGYAVAASPRGLEAADINKDGWLDLVTAGRTESTVTVLLRNPPNWGSGRDFVRNDAPAGSGARDVAVADFDTDGRLDVLTANEWASSVSVLSNRVELIPGGFRLESLALPMAGNSMVFAVADFDHNGKPDILKSDFVYFDGTRRSRLLRQPGSTAAPIGTAADVNGDGHLDVVFSESGGLRAYLGDGAGNFTDAPRTPASAGLWQMRSADVDRNGWPDIVVLSIGSGNGVTGAVETYLGRGDGTFTAGPRVAVPITARGLELSDLNRDGIIDAVATSPQGVHVLLGDSSGGWHSSTFEEGIPRSAVAIGDVTSDGIPDLVLSDMVVYSWGTTWGSRLTLARGLGDGTFETAGQTDLAEGQMSTYVMSLLLTDLNDDGALDVVTSSGHVLTVGAGQFSNPQPFQVAGNWGLMAADFNGDALVDLFGFASYNGGGDQTVLLNTRTPPSANRVPEGFAFPDTVRYAYSRYFYAEDEPEIWAGDLKDPDLHVVRMRWIFPDGHVVTTDRFGWAPGPEMTTGSYAMRLIVDDYRGGTITKDFTLIMTPYEEAVIHPQYDSILHGAWQIVADPSAADGRRIWHPNANAPKLQAPLATPNDYVDVGFLADPTLEYKLWLRMKADGDNWSNDSVFVQFTGARDAAGNAVYEIGSTSALAVNLEECSNCGIAGWGWEDDGWGAPDRNGVTLRFPEGGRQRLRIQTREDGVSIDQIVLSAVRYKTTRPGAAKNDTTRLPSTGPWMGTWWMQ